MKLLYDETHNQTWTLDPARAVELSRDSNEAPRYFSYAHLTDLVSSRFGGTVERVTTGPLTPTALAPDLLLLNHCCRLGHAHLGVGGEATFTAEEIADIRTFVEAGGGLLVLGEFESDSWGSNVNEILQLFGMRFRNDVATVSAQGMRGPLDLPVFETEGICAHPATGNVRKISYCSGCTIELLDRRVAPLVTSGKGAVLLAAVEVGTGRVVAVGDSDLFAEPYFSYNDNSELLVGLLAWLSGRSATATRERTPLEEETFHDLLARSLAPEAAPETIIDLSVSEHRVTQRLLDGMSLDPYSSFEAFSLEAKLAFHELPKRLRRVLMEFARKGNLDGALLLRGFAADPDLPPTPTRSGERSAKSTHASELWLCAVAAALGEPVGYLQEKQGSIFQDIFPTAANAEKLSSESSSEMLDFHTEIAFHPFMPDYLLLYALRHDPDREARTMFASVRRFFHLLEPADKDTLFANLFRSGVDFSFGNTRQERGAGPLTSVLYGDRLDPFLRYDLDLMVGQTKAAERALEHLRGLVNDVRMDVVIEPGSLLIIDNRRSVHARSRFKAAFDGRDRWLQRVAVVRDLEASIEDRLRGTRIIATDFSRYLTRIFEPGADSSGGRSAGDSLPPVQDS